MIYISRSRPWFDSRIGTGVILGLPDGKLAVQWIAKANNQVLDFDGMQ
jgi:hypothetical protein